MALARARVGLGAVDTSAFDTWKRLGVQIFQLHQAGQSIPADLQGQFQQAQQALAFAAYHPAQYSVGGVQFLDDGTVIDMAYGLPTGETLTQVQMDALRAGTATAVPGSGQVMAKVTAVSPGTTLAPGFTTGGAEGATVIAPTGAAPTVAQQQAVRQPAAAPTQSTVAPTPTPSPDVPASDHPADGFTAANPGNSGMTVLPSTPPQIDPTLPPSAPAASASGVPAWVWIAGAGVLAALAGAFRGRRG